MTTTDANSQAAPPRGSKVPLMLGAALALALGGGGFYAVQSGLLFADAGPPGGGERIAALADVGFVPLEPMVVSLGTPADRRHLRFEAQLEVVHGREEEVRQMLPRVTDVLNGYLRAVDVAELEAPAALLELRSQMLRRVQVVTGEGRVRDLLVMEFLIN